MRENKGSALVEYALPIALIGLVAGLSIYYLSSSGALTNLFGNSFNSTYSSTNKTLDINKNSDKVSLLINPMAGSFGGTSAQPIERCDGTQCSIDFGEFILTGIPEDFSEFVHSNGTSGGVDELCKLLLQIADQLEEKGDTAGAKDYRDLANLGYFYADLQEQIENAADSCKTTTSLSISGSCMVNQFNSFQFKTPDNLKSIIPYFPDASFYYYANNGYLALGQTMKRYREGTLDETKALYSPSYNIVTTFDKIIQDPNYSTSMKEVTIELYRVLADLSHSTFNRFARLNDYLQGIPYTPGYKIDPVTGETTNIMQDIYTFDISIVNDIQEPVSPVTDLDSSLICTTGKNDSDGNACN